MQSICNISGDILATTAALCLFQTVDSVLDISHVFSRTALLYYTMTMNIFALHRCNRRWKIMQIAFPVYVIVYVIYNTVCLNLVVVGYIRNRVAVVTRWSPSI